MPLQAHHPSALWVGVEHVVEVDFNRQRVFADQAQMGEAWTFEHGNRFAGKCPAAVTFAIAADASIGVDAEQRAPIVELHGFDGSDLGCRTSG